MNKMPKWFKEWEDNHFQTMKRQVKTNTRLLWILLAGLIIAALVEKLV